MTTRVILNKQGFVDVLTGGGTAAFLSARAERVASAVRADPHDDLFNYEDSVRVEVSQADGSKGALPRVRARVVVNDSKGHILEAKYGILARALDAAGGS